MFTLHYNSSQEELDDIKLGDTVGYRCGGYSKVIKITKEISYSGKFYVFSFEDGNERPIIVVKSSSRKQS